MLITSTDVLIFVIVCIFAFSAGMIFGGTSVQIPPPNRYNDSRKSTKKKHNEK